MTMPDGSVQGTEPNASGTDTNAGGGTTPPETTPPGNGGDNKPPYWQELESLPDSVRSLVEPHFKKWDSDVTKKFQEQAAQYEPWKPVIESADPDTVTQALQLLNILNTNPQYVYEQLAAAGFGQQQTPNGQQPLVQPNGQQNNEEELEPWQAQYQQMQEQFQVLAQAVLARHEQDMATAAETHLDATLNSLREELGEYDENTVLALIANGVDPKQAVQYAQSYVEQAIQARQRPPAPAVMGGRNAGTPSTTVDPTTLSSQDVKALVAERLRLAAEQG